MESGILSTNRLRVVVAHTYQFGIGLAALVLLLLGSDPGALSSQDWLVFVVLLLVSIACTALGFSLGRGLSVDLASLFSGAAVLTLGWIGVWVPFLSNLYYLIKEQRQQRGLPRLPRSAMFLFNVGMNILPPWIAVTLYHNVLGGDVPLADLEANLAPVSAYVAVQCLVILAGILPLVTAAERGIQGAVRWFTGVVVGLAVTSFASILFSPAVAVILNRLGIGFFLFIAAGLLGISLMARRLNALHEEALARERLEKELALARDIQTSFLPDGVPEVEGWAFAASLEPARHVSGDFYDFISLPGGRWGLIVADVADKGMPAALYMALARTLIRAYAAEHVSDPAGCLLAANDRIVTDTHSDLFVTVFYGVLDPADGRLIFCNAGHNPPCLCRHDGRPIESLTNTGMALGVLAGVPLDNGEVSLAPGDSLVLYTDGLTEAHNSAMEQFGSKRLVEHLAQAAGEQAGRLHDGIRARVRDFVGDAPRFDDLTLMVAERQ